MSTTYHTAITTGAAANAAIINAPLAQLDSALGTLADAVILGGAAVTQADGVAAAGQKVVTVDSTASFLGGCYVEYALAGGTLERNVVDTVDSATQLTLTTNIGTGGIPDNGLIAVIPEGFYNAGVGVYNVLDYGATGDGVTDDVVTIQAAATAIPALAGAGPYTGGGILYFPAGQYKISDAITLKPGTIVKGVSAHDTRLISSSTTANVFTVASNAQNMLRVAFRDFAINYTGTCSAGAAISLGDASNVSIGVEISNIEIWNAYRGIYGEKLVQGELRNVYVRAAVDCGFYFYSSTNVVTFLSCWAYACGSHGFRLKGNYCQFSNCAADYNTGDGYHLAYDSAGANAITFTSCGAENNDGNAFYFDRADKSAIIGAYITSCGHGVYLKDTNYIYLANIDIDSLDASGNGLTLNGTCNQTVTSNCTWIAGAGGAAISGTTDELITLGDRTGAARIGIGNADPATNIHITRPSGTSPIIRLTETSQGEIELRRNVYGFAVTDTSGNTKLSVAQNAKNFAVYVTSTSITLNETGDDVDTRIEGDNDANLIATDAGNDRVGVGIAAPTAKLHIDQSSGAGGVPVLTVDQADVSEEFIRFIGTSTTDNTQSLIDAADLETPGAIAGWLKIYVQDDQATNPITDGVYWIPFYATPTHSE